MTAVALCTGAGSGIGRATAVTLAERGATVVVSDVDVAGGEETVELVRAARGSAEFIRADIAEADEVCTDEDLDVQLQVNLRGTWLCAPSCGRWWLRGRDRS